MINAQDRAKREDALVQLVVLVFLGAVINLLIALGIMNSLPVVFSNQPQNPTLFYILIGLYLVAGIIFCVFVSLNFFHPKKVVPPTYVQFVSMSLIIVVIAITILPTSYPTLLDYLLALWVYSIFALFLILPVSAIQTPIVKWIIGLAGSKEDTSQINMLLNADIDDVQKILRSDGVLNSLKLTKENNPDLSTIIFRTNSLKLEQFFLVLHRPRKAPNTTQLVGVWYEKKPYEVVKSKEILDIQEMNIGHIKNKLEKAKISFKEIKEDLPPAQTIANEYALSATVPMIQSLKNISKTMKISLVGLVILFVGAIFARFFDWISVELFQTFIIFTLLGILFDLLPLFSKKKSGRWRDSF